MSSTPKSKIYEFDDFRLVPDEGLLLRNGSPVSLNPKSFAVLSMLVENHGHLVSKTDILESIWEGSFIEEGAISKAIWFARNALGDSSKERYIKTVPRKGYRFVAPVFVVGGSGAFRLPVEGHGTDSEVPPKLDDVAARIKDSAGELHTAAEGGPALNERSSDRVAPSTLVQNPRYITRDRLWVALLVGAALLVSAAVLYFLTRGGYTSGSERAVRVAVLPLNPLNEQSRDPIYDLGIAEALILKLGSRKDMNVTPLSTVRGYTTANTDALAVGRELKVDLVVTSNYQTGEGRIKVNSQLLNVATGTVESLIQVDHPLDSPVGIQDVIANDIGNKLFPSFGSAATDFRGRSGTNDREAYRFYLMAVNLTEERGVNNLIKAREYFERAVEIDPGYARAWAGLAHIHRDLVGHGDPDAKGHYEKSMEAINRALAIDPNLSDAYSALCNNKNRYEYDAVGAEAACRRAIELEPNSPLAHKIYANLLYSRGRFDEALEQIRIAIDLQPVSYQNQQIYGLTLFYARRYDDAEAQFKRLLDLNPNHNYIQRQLVTILEVQGKESEAFEFLIRSLNGAKTDSETVERFKTAYAMSGWRGVTIERINTRALESAPFHLAGLYARLGDKDNAFKHLELAYQQRSFLLAILHVAPQLDPLRDDPRFAAFVKKVEAK